IFIADFQISRLAFIFQVLRLLADRAGGIKFIPSTGAHWSAKRDMLLQPAILTKHYVRCDNAIRSNDCSGADFRAWIDNCRRMNLHVAHLSRNMNINSPSETTPPSTSHDHFLSPSRRRGDWVGSHEITMLP